MASVGLYILGILFAIISGIMNNIGTVLQKKVVNDINRKDPTQAKFFKSLVKNPMWLLGLVLQVAIGAVFFMLAQLWIGPTLIPGLMAAGLIVLAIASVKMVGESLETAEIIGIGSMIVGIALLGFSNLAIDILNTNLLDSGFLWRLGIFTGAAILLSVVFHITQKHVKHGRGILLTLESGLQFALSNLWISPLMGVIGKVFEGTSVPGEFVLFVLASIILPLTNVIGIGVLQQAFTYGQASNLVPIQQVPVQIAPIMYYFWVFLLPAPSVGAILLGFIGVGFIVVSTFLLAKRQVAIENIK